MERGRGGAGINESYESEDVVKTPLPEFPPPRH